ncbi:adenylate cyclase-associated protein-like protein [Dinothrombium tinctorium]|uniref:Adenylate cyclase-associated protein-like protein n=1 Tax=Dinothrombium tinctorium TaxID=1965070 RepID=A0A3S3NSX3_9ACAR|nr:adenylate cyclase-associated protein-like protein [Dinothrombium tinctorium]RWS01152.1 adenylate cyclase-associated protein-like protein [Dinothrombium tinctorium]RWS08048.1 adenylate cyclase-associated protein-like protein [Dinothrombium tinctorium]
MASVSNAGDVPFVREYDQLINGPFNEYLALSASVGGLVKAHSEMVAKAVSAQRQFLVIASMSQEPNQQTLVSLLKPTSDQIQAIQEFREKNRSSDVFNHLSTISESIPALGWVTVSPTPGPFVKEMTDSGQFYANKVLVAFKDKDKTQVDWAKSWISFLNELQKYIRVHHTTGLTWNAKGVDSSRVANGIPAAGGPPPPPPPPRDIFSEANAGVEEARLALMRDLNMGTDITKNLRKVTSDQQTHKNPVLKSQAPHPVSHIPSKTTPPAPQQTSVKPPKFELDGKRWLIEYQIGQKQLVVNCTEMNQSVSVYKCKDSVITVKGKANSITLDSCSKTGVVFDDIVSVVELINCQSVQAQSMGVLPTINVEKTDGAQIYLSKSSLNAEVVTAKSSAINVSVPNNVGDFSEFAIPEQFKSVWTGKGFKTEPTDIAG